MEKKLIQGYTRQLFGGPQPVIYGQPGPLLKRAGNPCPLEHAEFSRFALDCRHDLP